MGIKNTGSWYFEIQISGILYLGAMFMESIASASKWVNCEGRTPWYEQP